MPVEKKFCIIFVGCKGQQIVSHEDLTELDTRSRKKARDLVYKAAMGVNFAIVGIENQEEVDYSLPVRILEYDAVRYRQQVSTISKEVRKNIKGLKAGEYMYGFKKENRLYPIVTFILYAGIEPWDGPECLHDIIDFTDIPESIKELVQDYHIKLIDIRRLEDTEIFKTDVRQVFDFIRYAENKEELYRLVNSDSYYQHMDADAYEVVAKYAKLEDGTVKMDEYKRKDGKVDVCKGIRDLMEDSKREGIKEGIKEEREELITKMLKKGVTVADICELTELDTEYVEKIQERIK